MTAEEVIKTLETAKAEVEWDYPLDYAIAIEEAIEALELYDKLKDEMAKRNMTAEHIVGYMKFEDECVEKGFTFKSLIEAREKQIPKKPINVQDCYIPETYDYDYSLANCPNCRMAFSFDEYHRPLYCNGCGQKLSFKGLK